MPWNRSRPGSAAVYRQPLHAKTRRAYLEAFTPGDPCCLCGRPMWPPTRDLHLDHDPVTGGYRGLAHGRCNVRDGARRGRARQNSTRLTW
jgi:hypothetical protein